jgi:polysaccharide export outer membrane protein
VEPYLIIFFFVRPLAKLNLKMTLNSHLKSYYLVALFAVFLLSSCGSTSQHTLFSADSDVNIETLKDIYVVNDQGQADLYYKIKEGDVISIRNLQNKRWGVGSAGAASGGSESVAVTNTAETNAITYIVDDYGMVKLPALKAPVKIAGLTRKEATQKIQDLYVANLLVDPIIELNVVNLKVSLLGEFTTQGNYFLTKDNTTLLEILAEAGGIPKTADPRTLKIIRGKETIYVNLSDASIIGNRKLILQNNDIITIRQNKSTLDQERNQKFNNVIQPLLVVVNLVILVFTLSK